MAALRAILLMLVIGAQAGGASGETCGPIGLESGLIGKYFIYETRTLGVASAHMRVAAAPNSEGGVSWCLFIDEPERWTLAAIEHADANGVVFARQVALETGEIRLQRHYEPEEELRCQRQTGPCGPSGAFFSYCEGGVLVLSEPAIPTPDAPDPHPYQIRRAFRADGVLSHERISDGETLHEATLVEDGIWDGPSCLSAQLASATGLK